VKGKEVRSDTGGCLLKRMFVVGLTGVLGEAYSAGLRRL